MAERLTGKIIKGIGGFYYVDTELGVIECRARGKFRYDGITPLVGDVVSIEDAYVIDIFPRRNWLIRPKVANIDKAVLTFAAVKPKINIEILDRFLVLTAAAGVKAIICINKIDLVKGNALSDLKSAYSGCGCEFLEVSAESGFGVDKLKDALCGITSVFAGPSGAGKSTLINLLTSAGLKTGEISRISRGRHTTREAVLISIGEGGYIVDTPGFTSLSLEHIESKKLFEYFNEFSAFVDDCRFSGCSHINEPLEECGVKKQVGQGVHKSRYDCYVRIYNELSEKEEAKYD